MGTGGLRTGLWQVRGIRIIGSGRRFVDKDQECLGRSLISYLAKTFPDGLLCGLVARDASSGRRMYWRV